MKLYPLKTDTQDVAESKYEKQVSVEKGYIVRVSARNGQLNACEESLSQATAGRGDTKELYPFITETWNVARSKYEKQVSVRKGYLVHVSVKNGQLNACEESLSQATGKRRYNEKVSVKNGYAEYCLRKL